MKLKPKSKHPRRPATVAVSLIAVFAALNVVADFVPVSPVLGFTSFLTLGWILSPLAGLLLGPFSGGASCLIATLVEFFLGLNVAPQLSLGPAGFFRSALAAVQTGLLSSGRWKLASAVFGVLILGWLALPAGRAATGILVFHILGLVLILVSGRRMERSLESQSRWKAGAAVTVSSYCGNISRHLFGNTLLVVFVGLPAQIFLAAIPFTLVEQTFFSFASFALGTALIRLRLRQNTYIG
jgi:hypothetical protein